VDANRLVMAFRGAALLALGGFWGIWIYHHRMDGVFDNTELYTTYPLTPTHVYVFAHMFSHFDPTPGFHLTKSARLILL
jgi:peptide methionine sulfoxide reductase MsrA